MQSFIKLNLQKITNFDFFTLTGLFFIIFLWISLILAFLGWFNSVIPAIFGFFSLLFLLYIFHKKQLWKKPPREFVIVGGIVLIFVSFFAFFSEPTIFSGRDQGSLSNSAIILSENQKLIHSFPAQTEFFKIYQEGIALNFPGFNYDPDGNLVSHFPLGYISYLAFFYSLFGLFGFILANSLAFVFFLFSFYALSRHYLDKNSSLIALILILTSFVFSWFFKFTLSENLGLALVWLGLLQFILFLKNQKKIHLAVHLLTFGFLLFVRIETFAFLAVSLFILYRRSNNFQSFAKETLGKKNWVILTFIFLVFLFSLKANSAFYLVFAKGLLNSLGIEKSLEIEKNLSIFSPFLSVLYIIKVFSAYALLTYLALGIASFIYFFRKKNFEILIPFFILLPAFFYLLSPSVTLDHPWMLRRYVFAVIPLSIFYSVLFLKLFIPKTKIFYFFTFFLMLTNLLVFIPYLNVRENENLLQETQKLSAYFGKDDLILIDRGATGDHWSMLSGPLNLLFEKQAVYFFNYADLQKIDTKKFKNVYLVVADKDLASYPKEEFFENFEFFENYAINRNSLLVFSDKKEILLRSPVFLPAYQKNYTYGKIYLLKK